MSKTFKVVCINKALFDVGTVLQVDVDYDRNRYLLRLGGYVQKDNFLRLPTEPKTCADMSMEEYLAMVCLHCTNPDALQHYYYKKWQTCFSMTMISRKNDTFELRVKPDKSAKDIEIESIEVDMRKLEEMIRELKRE